MRKNQVLQTLKELINIPSYVSEDKDESKLVDYIYNFLSSNTNLKVERQNVENNRANIIAYKNKSPKIIFFGHMDTVPPKIETQNPFESREEDGKLYGLGSVDMKAGLAIMLEIAKVHKDSDDIAYVFTVDEEYEFKGAYKLIEKYVFRPKFIISIEPTSLKVLNGCRGVTEFSFETHGKSCHAGVKHQGINAIEKTVELFDLLQKEISKFDKPDTVNSLNLAYLNGGVLKLDGDVSYSGNVVPNYAKCVGEIRLADSKITKEYVKDKIREIGALLKLEITNIDFKFLVGHMYTPKENIKDFEDSVARNHLTCEYSSINETGYFEVQLLQEKWKGSVVIFGPGPTSMSHCANEYVDIDTVNQTLYVIEDFIKKEGAD
ncbi:MAG: M20/M25/M40 family metallo-hydrolase [Patescibacteria group bacterium]|nr:M20/M25/M40 family metallo-hydrolase [Patescibacteria group bacterium]MBU1952905.1 M20/M25/M40 family metallo-hydrolase [Patescibacteria group bacterium]